MQVPTIKYRHSEVNPWTDGKDKNYHGFETRRWAEDTAHLAKNSVNFYLAELVLKIPSYFIFKSDLKDKWWAKTIFTIERLTGTFGDMFRNFIYGHKDKDGERDDDVGLETHSGSYETLKIGEWNYHAQTKGKFITSVLGFISPELANDLEWAVVRALDSVWWRNMGTHLAYGPTYGKKIFNNNPSVFQNIKNHFNNAKKAWGQYSNGQAKDKSDGFLNFCQYTDKVASSFMPVINILNLIGDFGRPIARRLGITGIPRNTFRILSVIDRPFFWFTHLFRFYLPEKFCQKEEGINRSDLLLGSVAADIIDFGLIAFEDKIKDKSGSINQVIELARKFKDSAHDIYFAARRKRGLEELKKSTTNSD